MTDPSQPPDVPELHLQTPPPGPPPESSDTEDPKRALKTKRAGQTAITLFVLFIVSLLSFGRAPTTTMPAGRGWNLNIISALGVLAAVGALLFLVTSIHHLLRTTTTRKVLGLIGSIGLILHAALAMFYPL